MNKRETIRKMSPQEFSCAWSLFMMTKWKKSQEAVRVELRDLFAAEAKRRGL